MRTQSYPSDVTDEQWALIEPHIPVYPGGRPRTTDLRDVVDAIFYLLRTGCQWRYLPKLGKFGWELSCTQVDPIT